MRSQPQSTAPAPYGFPGPNIAGHQPFHSDNPYAPTTIAYPPTNTLPTAAPPISQAGYGYRNNSQPLYGTPISNPYQLSNPYAAVTPSQKRPTPNSKPLVISIGLIVLVIIIISAAIIYQGGRPKPSQTNNTHATSTIGAIAPTPTITPTPTIAPTPVPDAGFIWCGLECAPSGFMDEYPVGWQMSALTSSTGIQFINPQQPDQLVLVKTQDNPTAAADTLLLNELQNNYANQPGYQAPSPPAGQDTTIDGETWSSATILYQGANPQEEQVTAYVTVYQGKVFILEVQSAQAQFAQVSTAYYNIMIGKFQFI
jgi:hypothetical protein